MNTNNIIKIQGLILKPSDIETINSLIINSFILYIYKKSDAQDIIDKDRYIGRDIETRDNQDDTETLYAIGA